MAEQLVVIGGDAAGMSAAAQARRRRGAEELRITAFERGSFTSYSACGIPYWVGGEVARAEELIARTPEQHRAHGIDLRLRTEVTELDLAGRRVRSRDLASGAEAWHPYDQLVIATGAEPVRPALPGFDAPGVHLAHTLPDGRALLDTLAAVAPVDGAPVEEARARAAGDAGPWSSAVATSASRWPRRCCCAVTGSPWCTARPSRCRAWTRTWARWSGGR